MPHITAGGHLGWPTHADHSLHFARLVLVHGDLQHTACKSSTSVSCRLQGCPRLVSPATDLDVPRLLLNSGLRMQTRATRQPCCAP